MHYRNGREAKNGDVIVSLNGGKITALGALHSATPDNDYCNGMMAPVNAQAGACLCDCLHIDDVAEMLAEKGLDKRPEGKIIMDTAPDFEALRAKRNQCVMKIPREKYMNDSEYRKLVNMLESFVERARFTPSELREAAVLACINYEMARVRERTIDPRAEEAFHVLDEFTTRNPRR